MLFPDIKRKKRKIGPYSGGVSVSQLLAQRDKMAMTPPQGTIPKDQVTQFVPQQQVSPHITQSFWIFLIDLFFRHGLDR